MDDCETSAHVFSRFASQKRILYTQDGSICLIYILKKQDKQSSQ